MPSSGPCVGSGGDVMEPVGADPLDQRQRLEFATDGLAARRGRRRATNREIPQPAQK
jgi:hypothetical protein